MIGLTSNFYSQAQSTFPRNGVQDKDATVYAFTNATVHVDAKTVYENATLLVKEGPIPTTSGTNAGKIAPTWQANDLAETP